METIYPFVIAGMSVLTCLIYGLDKQRAIHKAWRVPEKVLLGLSLAGGALGGLAGMKLFRHKTKHWYFWFINFLAAALQLGYLLKLRAPI